MNMVKKCYVCGKIKSLESFHKSKAHKDGRNNKCAICVNNYNKRQNQKRGRTTDTSLRGLALLNDSKKDYHQMYLFLQSIGYDPTKDIHQQFCEKYNLPYKKRDEHSKNKFSYEESIKTDG